MKGGRCVSNMRPAAQSVRKHLQPSLLIGIYRERPEWAVHGPEAFDRPRAALMHERTLGLQEEIQLESRKPYAGPRQVPGMRPVVVGERRSLKHRFVTERLPERLIRHEEPGVEAERMFKHLPWRKQVRRASLQLRVERHFIGFFFKFGCGRHSLKLTCRLSIVNSWLPAYSI